MIAPIPLPTDKPELRRYIASRRQPKITILPTAYAEGAEPQPDFDPARLPEMEAE